MALVYGSMKIKVRKTSYLTYVNKSAAYNYEKSLHEYILVYLYVDDNMLIEIRVNRGYGK